MGINRIPFPYLITLLVLGLLCLVAYGIKIRKSRRNILPLVYVVGVNCILAIMVTCLNKWYPWLLNITTLSLVSIFLVFSILITVTIFHIREYKKGQLTKRQIHLIKLSGISFFISFLLIIAAVILYYTKF